MIDAIFFDIDGTLTSLKTQRVPSSTIEALNTLQNKGIKIFIATGRSPFELNDFSALNFDGYITLNGAYCVSNQNDIIYKKGIDDDDITALIDYQKHHYSFPCLFMNAKRKFINNINPTVQHISNILNLPLPQERDIDDMINDEVLQMCLYIDEIQEAQIMKKILLGCESSRWISYFVDINARGVNKRSGIDKIINYYDIDISKTMGFGDGGNDIPMLTHVAYSVAMGNANSYVKGFADYTTESVEDDGVWKALKFFKII